MTDSIKGCFIAFDHDIREDDVEPLINAIRCLKGVQSVEQHVADVEDWHARERVKGELWMKVYEAFFPERVKRSTP
jgi:hypothetical protein